MTGPLTLVEKASILTEALPWLETYAGKTANVLLLNAYQHLVTRRTHKIPVPLL